MVRSPRNESMANYLVVKGYMEARGRGLPIIRRAMRDFNGTEPRLENERLERFVRLTLWTGVRQSPHDVLYNRTEAT